MRSRKHQQELSAARQEIARLQAAEQRLHAALQAVMAQLKSLGLDLLPHVRDRVIDCLFSRPRND